MAVDEVETRGVKSLRVNLNEEVHRDFVAMFPMHGAITWAVNDLMEMFIDVCKDYPTFMKEARKAMETRAKFLGSSEGQLAFDFESGADDE